MTFSVFPRVFTLLSLLLVMASTSLADDPPAWLKQAAGMSVGMYDKDVHAVVLRHDSQVTLGSDGKLVTTENYAVKLLDRDGRRYAVAHGFYLVSGSKINDIRAWLIRPDGAVKNYDKKYVIDMIADPDDVYNEYRRKIIDATEDADAASVFGYTIESEESPLFYQGSWAFQDHLPTLASKYSLVLPTGWTATSATFNHADITPQISGSTYAWELRDLTPIPKEPMSPAIENLSPRIVVNYNPDPKSTGPNRSFATWTDVSRWGSGLHDPQVVVDDAVAGKARDLIAGTKTEIDRIRAIGKFVQNLQYIAIDIGVGYGNGYKPRPSTTVLGRGYGDCKDKANLMRAMLKAVGIEAFPVAIYAGDPTYVREQWPSPDQFNHCIIAIRVSPETQAPSVIEFAGLGRLMIFDATDPYTRVGDLPDHEQGSYALIIAGDKGGIAKMPISPPENDLLERTVEASIDADGQIKGKINEHATGQVSAYARGEMRSVSAGDFRKIIQGWLTRGATGAQLLNLDTKDAEDSTFDLSVDFAAPRYGQLMQGRLLVFKPVFVGRRNELALTEPKRTSPVELGALAMKETSVFSLPAGFVVDETPDAANIDTPFGKYTATYEVKGDKLYFTRKLVTNRTLVPVKDYDAVRSFFVKIREAEQAPVVLAKK